MKHFNNITTLIFDLGGVLINLDIDRCILNFKELGLENFEQLMSNFGQKGFFLQFEKGQISIEQFRDEIRKLTTYSLTDAQIDNAWSSFLVDLPTERLEILLELKRKFRLLLLSNTNPLHIEGAVPIEFAKAGKTMSDIFDKCYLSYQMGMAKPDPEIFEALLADAGVKPEECLFLDDGIKNIDQANKLNIQTYLVDTNEDLGFLLKPETWNCLVR
jgi:glucose-1-phosphatase